jgi:hypothetical protein
MLSACVACGEVLDLAGCVVGYGRDPLDAKPAIRRLIVNRLEAPADFCEALKLFVSVAGNWFRCTADSQQRAGV